MWTSYLRTMATKKKTGCDLKTKQIRTVVLVQNGINHTFHYNNNEVDSNQESSTFLVSTTAKDKIVESGNHGPTEDVLNGKENERGKRVPRVKLRPFPQTCESLTVCPGSNAISSVEEVSSVSATTGRLFALLLRLRVTEIVAGIVTILLGAVACLDTTTRFMLGLGIPVGTFTVLAAVYHIQASRRDFAALLGSSNALIISYESRFPRHVGIMRPLLPTLTCIVASLLLLVLSCMAAVGHEKNSVALGCLHAVCALAVLGTETAVWTLRWHCIMKSQCS